MYNVYIISTQLVNMNKLYYPNLILFFFMIEKKIVERSGAQIPFYGGFWSLNQMTDATDKQPPIGVYPIFVPSLPPKVDWCLWKWLERGLKECREGNKRFLEEVWLT